MSRGAGMGLPAMGLATPLGSSHSAVAARLFGGDRSGLVARDDLLPGRMVYVGACSEPLPLLPDDMRAFDCRNNRLMLAATLQIGDAVRRAARRYGRSRVAVVLGTSTSGIAEAEAAFAARQGEGAWPSGFDYRQQEAGSLATFIAAAFDLAGPVYVVTTACSSSAKVFASARRLIEAGFCDAAIVGGADTLCRMTLGGFDALGALSRGLCNPFSRHRDGINIGEAAAAFLLTQEPAAINLLGVGEGSDAHHISAPDPSGAGARAVMQAALLDAGLGPDQIAYVNLHGTGTNLNDAMEALAMQAVFGAPVPCSSTKAMTGHTLGAAGACEAAFLWLSLDRTSNPAGQLPPHLWDGAADPALPPLRFVHAGDRLPAPQGPVAMLSNSYAFGGSNAALILGRP